MAPGESTWRATTEVPQRTTSSSLSTSTRQETTWPTQEGSTEPEDLLDAVRAAAAGDAPLDPKAARVLLEDRAARSGPRLSAREEEVLRLVAAGLPNKLIARRLGISERTVKAHLTNVFASLGVTDRTQAALWAREHLPPEA
ncbi:MAG TPA: response regulator transcription factor [Acidimicrobiales bacterium]|nr:response regulator transcription factor [Acidimicrobiales bacterium]